MIQFIILLALLITGVRIAKKSYDYDILGFFIASLSGLFMFFHLISWLSVSYEYGSFIAKRAAFEQTLNEARKANREYETAAIVKDVASWNSKLASMKYDNKTWLFDTYVDDRIEDVQPIK